MNQPVPIGERTPDAITHPTNDLATETAASLPRTMLFNDAKNPDVGLLNEIKQVHTFRARPIFLRYVNDGWLQPLHQTVTCTARLFKHTSIRNRLQTFQTTTLNLLE